MSYRFVPEKVDIEYPPRIKEIVAEYERNGFEWKPDPDEDMETFKEYNYEIFAKRRPETVRQEIMAVYRLKDEYTNDEWMIYKIKKYANDGADRPYDAEVWMGKRPRFDTRSVTDENGNVVNKVITTWNMIYTIKWDPKEFDLIMKNVNKRNVPCYIAYTSDRYKQNHSGTLIQIKDQKIFRDSSYDELVAYDRKLERDRMTKEQEAKLVKAK